MSNDQYSGEVGSLSEVAYSWVHQGSKVWCAWCGVDRDCILDKELHLKYHGYMSDILENVLKDLYATNPGLKGSIEESMDKLGQIS